MRLLTRPLVLCLTALLLIASSAAAMDDTIITKGRLMKAIRTLEVKEAEQVLFNHVVDSWTLGYALMTTLKRTDSADERTAHRLAQLLIAKGAHLDYSDSTGRTNLMICAKKKFETIAMALLDAGADFRLRDDEGLDAWDYVEFGRGSGDTTLWVLNKARKEYEKNKRTCKISNLRAKLKGDCVVVHFDLEADRPVPIKMVATTTNGRTHTLPVRTTKGHVGRNVRPGEDRKIVWEVTKDLPRGFKGEQITIDVVVAQR